MRLRLIATVATGLVLAACSVLGLEAYRNGFSYSPCSWGWGERHQREQKALLQVIFHEPLPPSLQLTSFECAGFQDLQINSKFSFSGDDGPPFVEALNRTFETPQDSKYFEDRQKQRHKIAYPDHEAIIFHLPAARVLHDRQIDILAPRRAGAAWSAVFRGSQY